VCKMSNYLKYDPASLDLLFQTFRDNALVSPSCI
jgi:hypothetical protein